MSKRYIGDATIELKHDGDGAYHATIITESFKFTIPVFAPTYLKRDLGVDSAAMLDRIAEAAVFLAIGGAAQPDVADEIEDETSAAEHADGYIVRRR